MDQRFSLVCYTLVIGFLTVALAPAGETSQPPSANSGWKVVMSSDDSHQFLLTKDGRQWGGISIAMHRTGWQWEGTSVKGYAQDGVLDVTSPFFTSHKPDRFITVHQVTKLTSPNTITFTYTFSADSEQKVSTLMPSFSCNDDMTGTLDLYQADGTKTPEQRIPDFTRTLKDQSCVVGKMVWKLKDIGDVTVTMDPPFCAYPASYGGQTEMRMPFLYERGPAKGVFPAGTKIYTMTVTFPEKVQFVADKEGMNQLTQHLADASWYPLPATGTNAAQA